MQVATFRVNFLWSGLDLWWLHATNIGLHSTASLVVLWTARSVLGVSSVVSVAAALLFASHPVHAEAVAGLVGRAEILCTIFYCGGLGMYEKSRRQPLCLVVVFLMGAAALLSKEIGVTLPLACLWMDLWKQVLPTPVLEVRYEDLVRDLDGQSRRIIDFCDLEWDERCLRFWETGRTVLTLSSDQVRQPLYEQSIGRHSPWGASLDPLRDALGDAIDRYESKA